MLNVYALLIKFFLLFYRTPLTGLLYTVMYGGIQFEPSYIPVPVTPTALVASSTREYLGGVMYRVPDLHYIGIRGLLNRTSVDMLQETLTDLWKNATAGNIFIV